MRRREEDHDGDQRFQLLYQEILQNEEKYWNGYMICFGLKKVIEY